MPSSIKVSPLLDAINKVSAKTPLGTALRSEEISTLPLALREAAFKSARVESVRLLSEYQTGVIKALSGLKTSGGAIYDRNRFISDMRALAQELGVGKLGKSDITDMQGPARLGLIYDMQTRTAREHAKWKTSQDSDYLNEWPAQKLIRIGYRKVPRDWETRWDEAAASVAYEGVAKNAMVALKSSPIWYALSAFGTPWPPFDYNSGMGVEDVDRDEAEQFGLVEQGAELEPVGDKEFAEKLEYSTKGMQPEFVKLLEKSGLIITPEKAIYIPSTEISTGIKPGDDLFKSVNEMRKLLAVTGKVADPSGHVADFKPGIVKHWLSPENQKTVADISGRGAWQDMAAQAVRTPDATGYDAKGNRVYLKFDGDNTIKVVVGKNGEVITWIPTSLKAQRAKWMRGIQSGR